MNNNAQINCNIEDTAELLTRAKGGSRNMRIVLISLAVIAVLAIALTGWKLIGDKRYNDCIEIAEKEFIEGNYEQAEAEYLKAVAMKKRKPKAREGLAYTYAVQGKTEEAVDVYDNLYAETKDEKYAQASKDVSSGNLPLDPELSAAKGKWRTVNIETIPCYKTVQDLLYGLQNDYFGWNEYTIFDGNDLNGFPAMSILMTGIGAYEMPIEEFNSYLNGEADWSLLEPYQIYETKDGVDPRQWGVDEPYGEYRLCDVARTDEMLKTVFNVTDEDIKNLLIEGEREKKIYEQDGKYYCVGGWNLGTYNYAAEITGAWTDGQRYCIQYDAGRLDEVNYDLENPKVDRSEIVTVRYAIIEPKAIDGKHYWSLHYNSTEMPDEVNLNRQKEEKTAKVKELSEWKSANLQDFKENDTFQSFFKRYHQFNGPTNYDSRNVAESDILFRLTWDTDFLSYEEYPINWTVSDGGGIDPRGWAKTYGYEKGTGKYWYIGTNAEAVDWVAKNVFNVSEDDIERMLKAKEEEHLLYKEDGMYHNIAVGRLGAGMAPDISIQKILMDGKNYYIEYDLYGERNEVQYALITFKEESGAKYLSIYYNSTEPLTNIEGFKLQ